MTTASGNAKGADVAERLERLFREAPVEGVVAAWLFGSHAEGRAHRESDVDVGVLLRRDAYPTAAARFEARLALIARLGAALGTNAVDLVLLDDAPPLLGRHIVSAGRRVFCADAGAERDFRVRVQLRAADVAPFLRRMQKIKLEALRR
jgi:hypothetical protein